MNRALFLTLIVFAARCPSGVVCPADLRATFTPADTTIAVGQNFIARVDLKGCGGTQTLVDEITWTTQNSAVASAQQTTGFVTGVSAGATQILATGRTYGPLGGIHVTVTSP